MHDVAKIVALSNSDAIDKQEASVSERRRQRAPELLHPRGAVTVDVKILGYLEDDRTVPLQLEHGSDFGRLDDLGRVSHKDTVTVRPHGTFVGDASPLSDREHFACRGVLRAPYCTSHEQRPNPRSAAGSKEG